MKGRNFIFQSETDRRVRQWHFSFTSLLSVLGISIIILGVVLFISTEFLTRIIYQYKLKEIKENYSSLSSTLIDLQDRLDYLDKQMGVIEEKDKSVRTYANIPQIHKDIRDLGIGGIHLEKNTNLDFLTPEVETKFSKLEMNIEHLARKVKLELASYESIYDRVKEDSEKMRHIPSIRPVAGGYLNSGYGYRRDPFDRVKRFHYGQDFSVPSGTAIFAPADGIVQNARYKGGYGKYIKINHGYGYTTLFLHLSQINVKRGQKIKRGDFIGKTGNSGRSTAPHLHYEVHYFGTPQNPLDYFFSGYLN